jgi:hypothetical protein
MKAHARGLEERLVSATQERERAEGRQRELLDQYVEVSKKLEEEILGANTLRRERLEMMEQVRGRQRMEGGDCSRDGVSAHDTYRMRKFFKSFFVVAHLSNMYVSPGGGVP